MLLSSINHVIYFSQTQLLLGKTNKHRTANRKAILSTGCLCLVCFHCSVCGLAHFSFKLAERVGQRTSPITKINNKNNIHSSKHSLILLTVALSFQSQLHFYNLASFYERKLYLIPLIVALFYNCSSILNCSPIYLKVLIARNMFANIQLQRRFRYMFMFNS